MIRYDNFFLPSDNMEESKRFYIDVLGLSVKFDFNDHGMVAFRVGDEEPAIILKDRNKFPQIQPSLWIEVENVESAYQTLKAKGVHFFSEPFRIKTGWAVEFVDPSGNLLGMTDYNPE